MDKRNNGFTLVELMVVILIIGILASVSVPMMKGRVDRSKWSEACTAAGAIRTAIRNYAEETNITTAKILINANLGDASTRNALGFASQDLEGTYFSPANYSITSVNDYGIASITVTGGSKDNSPTGSCVLQEDGKWVMQ